jgi:hypothetical protein
MTKVIILSDDTLDRYYERTVQDLHEKFHSCPTNLTGNSLSEADVAQISYYDSMARELARRSSRSLGNEQDSIEERPQSDSRRWGCKPLSKIIF